MTWSSTQPLSSPPTSPCGSTPRDRRAAQLKALAAAYGIAGRVSSSPGSTARRPGRAYIPPGTTRRPLPSAPAPRVRRPLILDDGSQPGEAPPGARVVRSMAELLGELSAADDPPAPRCANGGFLDGQRVAIVTNYPTHYRVPLFNSMAARLSKAGASMRVLFTDAHRQRRQWMRPEAIAFEHEMLRSARLPGTSSEIPLFLEGRLREYRPSLVLVGGFSPLVAGRAASLASRRGAAVGIWSGEIASRRTARSRLRRTQRLRLLRRASFGIAYGYRGREYLRALAPTLPCVYGRNTVSFSPPLGTSEQQRGGGDTRGVPSRARQGP